MIEYLWVVPVTKKLFQRQPYYPVYLTMSGFLMYVVLRNDIDVCEYNDLRRYQDVIFDLFLNHRCGQGVQEQQKGV